MDKMMEVEEEEENNSINNMNITISKDSSL